MPAAAASLLVLLSAFVLPAEAQSNGEAIPAAQQAAEKQSTSVATKATKDLVPTCTCDCCKTAARTPSELKTNKTDVKCAADMNEPEQCPNQCEVGLEGSVVKNEQSKMQTLEYYCFVECKPTTTLIGSDCVLMTDEEIKKAESTDGTGEDIWATPESEMPATVPPPPAPMPEMGHVMDDQLVVAAPPGPSPPPAPKVDEAAEKAKADAAAAKAAALAADAKVQAVLKSTHEGAKKNADESEKFALEVRKTMEAPLSPNGFLVQVGNHELSWPRTYGTN